MYDDDDGSSLDYTRDIATWTRFGWNDHSKRSQSQPDSRTKLKPVGGRTFEVVLVSTGERKSAEFSNRAMKLKF